MEYTIFSANVEKRGFAKGVAAFMKAMNMLFDQAMDFVGIDLSEREEYRYFVEQALEQILMKEKNEQNDKKKSID